MGTENTARAFWVREPGVGELRHTEVPEPGPGDVLVRTLYSGVSRGTETLVFRGEVPASQREAMRCPFQEGDFPGPVKYGYMSVGVVEEASSPEWLGRTVFCLHPHQERFVVPATRVTAIPENVPPERAVLAANLETAVNGVWDGGPSVGDRIAVVGGGVVGLLVAHLARDVPGTEVVVVDPEPGREEVAAALGVQWVPDPGALSGDAAFDLVFHASGNPAGGAAALGLLGDEGTLVELSWYGERPVTLPLGEDFHARRLTIRSSQVGRIPPGRAPRWTHARRMGVVMRLLRDPALDLLVSGESPFEALPAVIRRLAGEEGGPPEPGGTLCHRIRYPGEGSG
jgi:2-desacetyl-2-hydroxyethyl bacteriochlorophyllide A dehydrogenase